MKYNKRFFSVLMIITGTIYANAQVQNYSGHTGLGDIIGFVPGTEKYSYRVNEQGDKLLTGTYTFSGEKNIKGTLGEHVHGIYKLSAQVKDGKLNGTFSQSATYTGRGWSQYSGWEDINSKSSLSGVFLNGEPNGTFNYVYKEDWNFLGTATLKNKKFIGVFKFFGLGEDDMLTEISGQLTNDGKYTGKWKVKIGMYSVDYVFQNNIAISKTEEQITTPPSVQALARQYAEGKITEEKLNEQGVFLEQHEIPLTNIIEMFYNKEYALEEIPVKFSFAGYKSPKFTYLIKLNSFTSAGFSFWINYIRQNGFLDGYNDPESYKSCSTIPVFEEEYKRYRVSGSDDFVQTYATLHNENHIYLSEKQMTEYMHIQDSIVKANAVPFVTYLINSEDFHRNEASNSGELLDLYKTNKQDFLSYIGKNVTELDNTIKEINNTKREIDYNNYYGHYEYYMDSLYFKHYFRKSGEYLFVKNEANLLDSLTHSITNIQKQYLDYKKDVETIFENNKKILSLSKPNKNITTEYKAYQKSINTSWVGLESIEHVKGILTQQEQYIEAISSYYNLVTQIENKNAKISMQSKKDKLVNKDFSAYTKNLDLTWNGVETPSKLESIIVKQKQYEETIDRYLTLKQQIEDNNNTIMELSKNDKIVSKDYSLFVKSMDINWDGLNTNSKLENIIEQQNQYQEAINIFLSKSTQIVQNNKQLQVDLKPYKQTTKAFQSYIKSTDITWKGLTPNDKLDEFIQIQESLLSALSTSQLSEIETDIKKIKNISIEDIINRLSK